MYRVVLKSRAFVRVHHSTFTPVRWLGLLWVGLFAATTLGSMTLGSMPAYAVCTSNANGGNPDNVGHVIVWSLSRFARVEPDDLTDQQQSLANHDNPIDRNRYRR